jgi:DNA-directed RNA polymerase subunit RPC12/RpoP
MSQPVQRCPRCGAPMSAIKGSRDAVCRVCGYKDDCCMRPG